MLSEEGLKFTSSCSKTLSLNNLSTSLQAPVCPFKREKCSRRPGVPTQRSPSSQDIDWVTAIPKETQRNPQSPRQPASCQYSKGQAGRGWEFGGDPDNLERSVPAKLFQGAHPAPGRGGQLCLWPSRGESPDSYCHLYKPRASSSSRHFRWVCSWEENGWWGPGGAWQRDAGSRRLLALRWGMEGYPLWIYPLYPWLCLARSKKPPLQGLSATLAPGWDRGLHPSHAALPLCHRHRATALGLAPDGA